MDLETFLQRSEVKGTEFAERIGMSPNYLYHIAKGRRAFPLGYVKRAVGASGGLLTERDLRPDDWHHIWPELAEKVA